MPRRARRDIFADAKVILCRWHSDIIFAVYTREANITRQRRISLHSNTSRRKANITEKAIVKCNRFFMWQDYEKDFSRVSHMTPNFHIAFFLANKLLLFS